MADLAAPQLVVHSRMLQIGWLPADPDAVAALVPLGLRPGQGRQVLLTQYVVDDASQTSGLGAYSLTSLGIAVLGADQATGPAAGPARPGTRAVGIVGGWTTHHLISSPRVRDYATGQGLLVAPAVTSLHLRGDRLTALTEVDGAPLIRTRVRVGQTGVDVHSGQKRYLTARQGRLVTGLHPFVVEPVTPFEVESVEFLVPGHPVYGLRPANPLCVVGGFYSPRASFAYPGQERGVDHPGQDRGVEWDGRGGDASERGGDAGLRVGAGFRAHGG